MDGDLGARGAIVHEDAQSVLAFWFALTPEQHFGKDAELDAALTERFGALRDAVLADSAAEWRGDPETLLAAIILLDQVSRNMHRGDARAYDGDTLALALTMEAIDKGWDMRLPPERRVFLYMPLMHAESLAVQHLSVRKFEALGVEENLRFAVEHRDVIARFDRYPSRNAALGRESTPEEQAYLSQPGAGW